MPDGARLCQMVGSVSLTETVYSRIPFDTSHEFTPTNVQRIVSMSACTAKDRGYRARILNREILDLPGQAGNALL